MPDSPARRTFLAACAAGAASLAWRAAFAADAATSWPRYRDAIVVDA